MSDSIFVSKGALLEFIADNLTNLSASTNISASAFYGDGANLTNVDGGGGIEWYGSTANGVATYKDADEATVESNLTFDGSTLTVTGDASITGDTTLGNASNDTVTINATNITLTNVASMTGTDNTVLICDGTSVATDEIDSRVWGSTLVAASGTPADNEIAIWTNSTTIEGDSNFTWNGSTLDVGGALTVDGNTTLGDAYSDTVTIQAATTTLTPTSNQLPQLKLESKNGTVDNAGEIRFERYDDTVIQAGESLGEILFDATETDNGTYYSAATITGEVGTGTWTDASSHPGAIRFWTCADSGTTLTERMSIESDGTVAISPDSDAYADIGRARVGYGGGYSDYAWFSHVDATAAGEYAIIQSTGGSTFLNAATGGDVYFRINNTNYMTLDSAGKFDASDAQEAWTAVAYGTGWADYSVGYLGVSYMKDSLGFIHIRGMAKKTSGTADLVFTLPAGYRPANRLIFSVQYYDASVTYVHGRADVQTDGKVTIEYPSTPAVGDWVSFGAINFDTQAEP